VDLDNDRLQVYYDPARLSTPALVQCVAGQGFAATVVAGGARVPP
jgi:hypothetical protein